MLLELAGLFWLDNILNLKKFKKWDKTFNKKIILRDHWIPGIHLTKISRYCSNTARNPKTVQNVKLSIHAAVSTRTSSIDPQLLLEELFSAMNEWRIYQITTLYLKVRLSFEELSYFLEYEVTHSLLQICALSLPEPTLFQRAKLA